MPTPDLPPIDPVLREQLRRDIERRGILIPIIISSDGEVLDGRLRVSIAQEHGLYCPKIIVGRLSPHERADLRVCVNLYRRHLTREQIRHLVEWALRQEPEASDRSVARKCGVNDKTVAAVRKQSGAELPHVGHRLGADGKRYPSARKPIVHTTSNAQAVEAQHLLGELGAEVPDGHIGIKKLRRIRNARERADALTKMSRGTPRLGRDYRIHHCDFRRLGARIAPGSVDFALVDPPWGGEFAPLRTEFAETVARLLKPDGLVACYTGVAHLPEFLAAFCASGLKYRWTLVGGRQVSSVQQRNMLINRWVPIVVCSKGAFRPAGPLNDVMDMCERDKSLHPWQQPVDEAVTLIKALSRPGAMICDLWIGSGSTAVATVEVGEGRRFAGCEIDATLVRAARCRVAEALAERREAFELELATV